MIRVSGSMMTEMTVRMRMTLIDTIRCDAVGGGAQTLDHLSVVLDDIVGAGESIGDIAEIHIKLLLNDRSVLCVPGF